MVSLVEQMLEIHKKLGGAKLSNEKEMIQRRIDATDSEIDRLVYDLYRLTDEDIKIVEGSCSSTKKVQVRRGKLSQTTSLN